MITINLNLLKNGLKLAMLVAITYLVFNLTANYNIGVFKTQSSDTVVTFPNYLFK